MKFESIKEGGRYYMTKRQKMGNTTMSSIAVFSVLVESVNTEKRTVLASWNGNPARTFYERDFSKWRLTKPVLVGSMSKRIATRAEIAAMGLKD